MTFVQVITPNLNVAAQLGWCLAYVQNAFGVGWTGEYAVDGWNRNRANHADRDIPSGVYMPVWFTGMWGGFNYGHVVIYKDGVCFSSPYTIKNSHDRLGSIAEVERIYGMTYLGWSEDMNGQRVIKKKEEKEMLTQAQLEVLMRLYRHKSPTAAQTANYVGKITFEDMQAQLKRSSITRALAKQAAAGKLDAKDFLPSEIRNVYVAPTPPGFEEVSEPLYRKK